MAGGEKEKKDRWEREEDKENYQHSPSTDILGNCRMKG